MNGVRMNSGNTMRIKIGRDWWIVILGAVIGAAIASQGWPLEGGAIAVLSFAPVYYYNDRQMMPTVLIGPLTIVYAFHALGYALGPLTQRYLLNADSFVERGFIQAQWGAVIGLATFALAYPRILLTVTGSRRPAELSNALAGITPDTWKRFTATLLAFFVLNTIYGFVSGARRRLGGLADVDTSTQSIAALLNDINSITWFFVAYCMVRFKGRWRLVWLSSYIGYAGIVFLDGSRGPVVFATLFSAIGAAAAGLSRKKTLALLALFAVVFSPFAGVISDYRQQYRGDPVSLTDRAEQLASTVNRPQSTDSGLTNWSFTIFVQSTAHAVDQIYALTPDLIPFAGFDAVDNLLYLYVPRVIKPDRVTLNDGNLIACQYKIAIGQSPPDDAQCAQGEYTPTVGDAYRRFGWAGIPMLYLLQAVIFGLSFRITMSRSSQIEWLAMFLVVLSLIQSAWTNTLISSFYLVGWTFLKDFAVLLGVRKLADVLRKDISAAPARAES